MLAFVRLHQRACQLPPSYLDTCTDEFFPVIPNHTRSCMWCRHKSPITTNSEVHEGDHIIFKRQLGYEHHGIVVRIVYKTQSSVVVSVVQAAPNIQLSEETILFNGMFEKVWYTSPKFTPCQIIYRANEALNYPTFQYNLLTNNCEHFATWCVMDVPFSEQVLNTLTGDCVADRLNFNELKDMHQQATICDNCYVRIMQIALQPKMRKVRPEDVHKGDIITYKYYGMSHDAVVVHVDEGWIKLIHYGARNIFRRTIFTEYVDFTENSKKQLFRWDFTNWCVFPTEEVIARATSRLGEKKWNLINNRAVHFARSCKIQFPQWYYQLLPPDHPEHPDSPKSEDFDGKDEYKTCRRQCLGDVKITMHRNPKSLK